MENEKPLTRSSFTYGQRTNRVTIHDLRLEVDGRVAQIDHLIIDRLFTIWVCESKHFAEGVAVNDHGEWSRFWGGRPTGIPSPVEQNRKHIAVLRDVFDRGLVEPLRRFGIAVKPDFRSVVRVSTGARISRPRSKAAAAAAGMDQVINVDQLKGLIDADLDARSAATLARVIGESTLHRDRSGVGGPALVLWRDRSGRDDSGLRRGQLGRPRPNPAAVETAERPVIPAERQSRQVC